MQVRESTENQNKRKEQMKSFLNNRVATQTIETTQVFHPKDLAKSTTRAQTLTLFGVQIQVSGSKQMQDKKLDQMKPSLNNIRAARSSNIFQSELPKRKLSSRNQGQGAMIEEQSSKKKKYIPKYLSVSLGELFEKNQQSHEMEKSKEESREESHQEQGIEGDINYGTSKGIFLLFFILTHSSFSCFYIVHS